MDWILALMCQQHFGQLAVVEPSPYHPLLCTASKCSTILWIVCCWTLHTAVLCNLWCLGDSPQCYRVCTTWRSPHRTFPQRQVCREGLKRYSVQTNLIQLIQMGFCFVMDDLYELKLSRFLFTTSIHQKSSLSISLDDDDDPRNEICNASMFKDDKKLWYGQKLEGEKKTMCFICVSDEMSLLQVILLRNKNTSKWAKVC